MKLFQYQNLLEKSDVAPLVGAWIEMLPNGTHELIKIVAPLVGAWIEIKEV